MLIEELSAAMRSILEREIDQFSQLVADRLSAESWLQFKVSDELGAAVKREYPYPTNPLGQRHVDFWRKESDGTESWVELKTCITNYDRKFGVAKTKNITNQIHWITGDIKKLQSLNDKTAHCHCLVLAYPLYSDHENHHFWQDLLNRLRSEAEVELKFEVPVFYNDQESLAAAYILHITT